jgi:hypothetical protein
MAGLRPADRARLVLDVVHAATTRLGLERGWDQDALAAAYTRTLAAGLRYRWNGPAKSSPDRRHSARPLFVLHDDGYGRVVIEVRRRADDQVVAVSAPALAFSTAAGFQRSAQTLRWQDSTTVEAIPWAGLYGDKQGLIRVDLTNPGSPGIAEPSPPGFGESGEATDLPAITVQVPDDRGARIEVIGGGPMNDIPAGYETTLHTLLERIQTEPWQAWWAAGATDVLEIWYDFAAARAGVTIRHGHGRWRTTIRRPAATFATTTDPVTLAREDTTAMLKAIQRRTGLSGHPPL